MKKYETAISITFLAFALFSLLLPFASAQYQTQQSVVITIGPSGRIQVSQSLTAGDVTIDITGTPGATGIVSTATYSTNPQATASIPADVSLTHFVVVAFNISPNQFQSANITIKFTDAEVAGINPPYVLYKYSPLIDSYIQLNSVSDLSAKTITAMLTSPDDPLFAIGGSTVATPQPQDTPIWILVAIAVVIVIVVIAAVLLLRTRYSFEIQLGNGNSPKSSRKNN